MSLTARQFDALEFLIRRAGQVVSLRSSNQFELGTGDLDRRVNSDDVTDPVTILSRLLAVTGPAIVLVLGALTWWLTGRTLRPVEEMRRELAEITGTNLGRRVAELATGDETTALPTP